MIQLKSNICVAYKVVMQLGFANCVAYTVVTQLKSTNCVAYTCKTQLAKPNCVVNHEWQLQVFRWSSGFSSVPMTTVGKSEYLRFFGNRYHCLDTCGLALDKLTDVIMLEYDTFYS